MIAGLAIILVSIILGATFFDRQEARLIELSERDSDAAGAGEAEVSEEYWAVSKRFARVGRLASVLIVVAVFLKVAKP